MTEGWQSKLLQPAQLLGPCNATNAIVKKQASCYRKSDEGELTVAALKACHRPQVALAWA